MCCKCMSAFTTLSKETKDSNTTCEMDTHTGDLLTECLYWSAICEQWGCFYQNATVSSAQQRLDLWRIERTGHWLQLAWNSDGGQLCCQAGVGVVEEEEDKESPERQGGVEVTLYLHYQRGQWKPFISQRILEYSYWGTIISDCVTDGQTTAAWLLFFTVQPAWRNATRTQPACS